MITKVYTWHCQYKDVDNYTHFRRLPNAFNSESARIEALRLPGFKKLYQVFRRSEWDFKE